MNKADETGQERKPKICKLAIASPLIGFLGYLTGVVINQKHISVLILGTLFILVSQVAGLVLGIAAIQKINKSNGTLKGDFFSRIGLVFTISILILMSVALLICPPHHVVGPCGSNLAAIGKAILIYTHYDGGGKYPTPDKWCDLLIKDADVSKEQFVCSSALKTGDKGPCHYAINPNCGPNSPEDTVLLFETKGGWNQHGGPELLTVEHHEGQGCNILFKDTRVKFIRTEQLGELQWGEK